MEKPSIVSEYEAGKAIPNPQILSKLDRALGCVGVRPARAWPARARAPGAPPSAAVLAAYRRLSLSPLPVLCVVL